jgi:hypothetical protein
MFTLSHEGPCPSVCAPRVPSLSFPDAAPQLRPPIVTSLALSHVEGNGVGRDFFLPLRSCEAEGLFTLILEGRSENSALSLTRFVSDEISLLLAPSQRKFVYPSTHKSVFNW